MPESKVLTNTTIGQIMQLVAAQVGIILNSGRTYIQFLDALDKQLRNICPFCKEHFDYKKNSILMSFGWFWFKWVVWLNPYDHEGTSHHYIIAPVRHIENEQDMNWWDVIAKHILLKRIAKLHGGEIQGATVTRSGDPDNSARSIMHLHINVLYPDGSIYLRETICKDEAKLQKTRTKTLVFWKLHEANVDPYEVAQNHELAKAVLSGEEYEIVKDFLCIPEMLKK